MSERKQLRRSRRLVNTTTLDAPSQVNIKSARIGQRHTRPQREKRNERRRELVSYKGGTCERCRQQFPYVAFDFHHADPTTKAFPLSQRNMERKWESLIAEADKCHLLCSTCHRLVHFENDERFIKS